MFNCTKCCFAGISESEWDVPAGLQYFKPCIESGEYTCDGVGGIGTILIAIGDQAYLVDACIRERYSRSGQVGSIVGSARDVEVPVIVPDERTVI